MRAAEQLKQFVERISRLEQEKAALAADIREVYSEAVAAGFDRQTLRQIVKEEQKHPEDRDEDAARLDLYRRELAKVRQIQAA